MRFGFRLLRRKRFVNGRMAKSKNPKPLTIGRLNQNVTACFAQKFSARSKTGNAYAANINAFVIGAWCARSAASKSRRPKSDENAWGILNLPVRFPISGFSKACQAGSVNCSTCRSKNSKRFCISKIMSLLIRAARIWTKNNC